MFRLRRPDPSRNGPINSLLPYRRPGDYAGNTDPVNRIVFNVTGLPVIGLETREVGIFIVAMKHRNRREDLPRDFSETPLDFDESWVAQHDLPLT